MPTLLSGYPFLSLKSDDSSGKHQEDSTQTKNNTNKHTKGLNGSQTAKEDEFPKLSNPQQNVLLLHGPRQRYTLEESKDIPELRTDRELLVQVVAIALNPVDWKGADFGFGSPTYPWIHGREFQWHSRQGSRKNLTSKGWRCCVWAFDR